MKPWSEHHKRVRVPFSTVANGYGGGRKIRGLPGIWQIVEVVQNNCEGKSKTLTSDVIVTPARGGK